MSGSTITLNTGGGITLSLDQSISRTAITTTPAGNVFVSSTDPKIGNGSARFGGATSITANTSLLLLNTSSTTTIEFWVKDALAPVHVYLSMGNFSNNAGNNWWQLYTQSNNRLELGKPFAAVTVSPANTYYANGNWNHFAWTISGANNKWYINGNLFHSFTRTASEWTTINNVMAIGAQNPTAAGLIGNMDEFRFSNSVRYTANFTPQTTAFTNDANTVLLLHMDGANGTTSFPDDNTSFTSSAGVTFTL